MTKRMTAEDIEAIRKRAEAAYPGSQTEIDFFTNAYTDIPALLAEVERLRAENEEYKGALSQIAHGDTWTAYPHDIAAWALGLKTEAIRID